MTTVAKATIGEYPEEYRESILYIAEKTHIDYASALAMMMLTATLMDLRPGDERVVDMILSDFDACRKRETK